MLATLTNDRQSDYGNELRTTSAPGTVLVVDDDSLTRALIRELVEPIASEVIEASDGRSACKVCRVARPDLVILDLVMPEQDGFETLKALRTDYPGVRIIVMSGAFDGMFLRAAKRLGANATLNKPFTAKELTQAILSAESSNE